MSRSFRLLVTQVLCVIMFASPEIVQKTALGACYTSQNVPAASTGCPNCRLGNLSLTGDCGAGWSYRDGYTGCSMPTVLVGITCAEGPVIYSYGSCSIWFSSISSWCLVGAMGIGVGGCVVACIPLLAGTPPAYVACALACLAAVGIGAATLMFYICDCSSGCQANADGAAVTVPYSKYSDVCIDRS